MYVGLYFDTLKEIGKDATSALWYDIGLNVSIRYFSFLRSKVFSRTHALDVLHYFAKIFSGAGMGICDNVEYNSRNKTFSFWGSNTVVCTRSDNYSFSFGILSGMLQFLFRRKFEFNVGGSQAHPTLQG